jgi:hypothetical protein
MNRCSCAKAICIKILLHSVVNLWPQSSAAFLPLNRTLLIFFQEQRAKVNIRRTK